MTRLLSLRRRFDRRKLALLAVFAIALTGSGISSLATINDNIVATVNGSVTSIDFRFGNNNQKTITLNLPTGLTPGDVTWQPLALSNAASNGYVRVTTSITSVTGLSLAADTNYVVFQGVAPAQCNSGSGLVPDFDGAGGKSLSEAPWDNEQQIDAGNTLDLCLAYRIGTANTNYPGGDTTFSQVMAFNGMYP